MYPIKIQNNDAQNVAVRAKIDRGVSIDDMNNNFKSLKILINEKK